MTKMTTDKGLETILSITNNPDVNIALANQVFEGQAITSHQEAAQIAAVKENLDAIAAYIEGFRHELNQALLSFERECSADKRQLRNEWTNLRSLRVLARLFENGATLHSFESPDVGMGVGKGYLVRNPEGGDVFKVKDIMQFEREFGGVHSGNIGHKDRGMVVPLVSRDDNEIFIHIQAEDEQGEIATFCITFDGDKKEVVQTQGNHIHMSVSTALVPQVETSAPVDVLGVDAGRRIKVLLDRFVESHQAYTAKYGEELAMIFRRTNSNK